MSKLINIQIETATGLEESQRKSSYLFLTNGKEYIQGVLSYTYSWYEHIGGDIVGTKKSERGLFKKLSSAPYKDYSLSTYNVLSTITVDDFLEDVHVKPLDGITPKGYETDPHNQITYSYVLTTNIADNENLYVAISNNDSNVNGTSSSNDIKIRLAVKYQTSTTYFNGYSGITSYSVIGSPELAAGSIEVINNFNENTGKGIQVITNNNGTAVEKFVYEYYDYVKNSKHLYIEKVDDNVFEQNPNRLYAVNTRINANNIGARSTIYQIPGSELKNNAYITLYYDGKHLTEKNPHIIPDSEEKDHTISEVSYTYYVNSSSGEVTENAPYQTSYYYSYIFSPNLIVGMTEPEEGEEPIPDGTYTSSLILIDDIEDYDQKKQEVKREKSWSDETGTKYMYSYNWSIKNISGTDYCAATYTFTYSCENIYVKETIDYISYSFEQGTNVIFENNEGPLTPIKGVSESNDFVLDDENYHSMDVRVYGKEHPYYKIQYSDDELKTISNVNIKDGFKDVNINISKDLFYLNIIQKETNSSSEQWIPKIVTSADIKYYQTYDKVFNDGWIFAFERIDKSTTDSVIYIGIPRTAIDSANDNKIREKYDVTLKVHYVDAEEEEEKQKDEKQKEEQTTSEIKQASNIVESVSINSPIISTDTEYFYTDDMYNRSGHIYTYVTPIVTSSGVEYFGVRAKKKIETKLNSQNLAFVKNGSDSIIPPEISRTVFGSYYFGYNLPARVVKLTDAKTVDYIYSFKNGPQYVIISDNWKQKELFPSKVSSYEFVLQGKDAPKYYTTFTTATTVATNLNVRSIYDVYEDDGTVKNVFSTYYITVNFNKPIQSVNKYKEIKNSDGFEISFGNTYENEYLQIDPTDIEFVNNKHIGLYNRYVTYTEVHPAGQTDYDYIHKLTENEVLCKYDSYNGTYKKYSVSELSGITSTTKLYEEYTIYKEISNNEDNINDGDVFIKKYDYVEHDKNTEPTSPVYYVKRPNTQNTTYNYTYVKQGAGIVTDNSIQYYRITYSLIDEKHLERYRDTNTLVYIKQPCRKVTQDEFDKLKNEGVTFYINESDINMVDISTTTLVDNIDLTGNTIYLDEEGKAIDAKDLKEKVSKQITLASAGLTSMKEVQIRKDLTKQGKVTGKTTFSATNVAKKILKLDAKFTPKDFKEWKSNIYVKEECFVSTDVKYISVGSNYEYYAAIIDKISPSDIKTLDIESGNDNIYIDAYEILPECDTAFTVNSGWGKYKNPVTNNEVILAKVNKYGFIEKDDVHYYERVENVTSSHDLFLHPNKVYFKYETESKELNLSEQIELSHTSYQDNKIIFDESYADYNNSDFEFLWDSVRYFKASKQVHYIDETPYDEAKDIPSPIRDNELIRTSFLYTTYTINDGISKAKSGSYYTNIYVFDKNNGSVNKTLYLDQHTISLDKYTYVCSSSTLIKVESDTIIKNVSPANYSNYWITYDGTAEIYQLNEYSDAPSYFFSLPTYALYVDTKITKQFDYSCTSEIGTYQYFDGLTYVPKTCILDDNLFGIISYQYDISSYFAEDVEVDDVTYTNSYNLWDLEVVKLYEFSKNRGGTILQDLTTTTHALENNIPFTLSNETTYTPTGTYTWHNPVHEDRIYDNGSSYKFVDVEVSAGYWTNDYERNIIPLQIASYTFYPSTNEVSNISATYSFVPNSYVLTANVEYPEIAYNTITVTSEEHIYYSYMYNGKEQYYDANAKIQYNADGTYTGLVAQKVFDPESSAFVRVLSPIKLTQHKAVIKNSNVTNVVNQEHRNDTKYFAYKTSLALTNEKVPILYNTELMPATTKQIQYWDEETSTYETKTVIASYAYYSYQYMYDTIPLKVASYMYQASYLTIDNFEKIGEYVEKAGEKLVEGTQEFTKEFNKWTSYYKTSENSKNANLAKTYQLLSAYIKDGYVAVSNHIDNAGNNITNAINKASTNIVSIEKENNENLVTTLSLGSYNVVSSIDTLNGSLIEGIDAHKNDVTTSINTLSAYVKNMVKDVTFNKSSEIVTYNGVVVAYNFVQDDTLNSVSDLIMKSFVTTNVSSYAYTDELGYTHSIINYTYSGLSDVLKRIQIAQAIPTKNEFVVELSQKMFANTDFDTEIVDDIKYDDNGNVTEKKTHKNNPTEMAKKIIYRAGILWDELAKAGYCEDEVVLQKQLKLNAIKTAAKASKNATTAEERAQAAEELSKALSTKIKK